VSQSQEGGGITANSRVVARDGLLHSELDDATVVFDPTEGTYYSLNEVGALVLKLIREPADVEGIVSQITERFQVAPEECRDDVIELLAQLADAGLVQVLPPPAP
jgi:PqqD family protein of HPr-rel-A system